MRFEVIYTGIDSDAGISAQLRAISAFAAGTHIAAGRKSLLLALSRAVQNSDAVFIIDGAEGMDVAQEISQAVGIGSRRYDNIFGHDGEDAAVTVPLGAKMFVGSDYIYHGCAVESGPQSLIFIPAGQENIGEVFEQYVFPFLYEKYGIQPQKEEHVSFEEIIPKTDEPVQEEKVHLYSTGDMENSDEDVYAARGKSGKKKGARRFIAGTAIYCVLVAALFAAFFMVYDKYLAVYVADTTYSRLRNDYGQEHSSSPEQILGKFGKLYSVNERVAGWLKIDGTSIDHPVEFIGDKDEEYFQNHLFDGIYNKYGSIYMSKKYNAAPGAENKNTVIIGSNTGDSRMMSDLVKYKDIEFYKSGGYAVSMDTVYEEKQWVVFAAMITSEDKSIFDYTRTSFADDNEFSDYIAAARGRSFLVSPVEVAAGDDILTLVTKYSEKDNTVIAVMAKRVEQGTASGYDVSSAYINESNLTMSGVVEPSDMNLPIKQTAVTEDIDAFYTSEPYMPSSSPSSLLSSLLPSSISSSSSRLASSSKVSSSSKLSSSSRPHSSSSAPQSVSQNSETTVTSQPPAVSPPPLSGSNVTLTVKNQFTGAIVTGDAVSIVAQVVEAEMGSSFNIEALKAQAVAAYTYLCYNGAADSSAPSAPMKTAGARSLQAANAVLGKTLKYNGRLCNSVYSAMSAGKTAASADVWGGSIPYLVSVDSSVDVQCKNYQTTRTYSASLLAECVKNQYGVDLNSVEDKNSWIQPTYDATGLYVKSINYGGLTTQKGIHLRYNVLTSARVGSSNVLRSHAFTVKYDAGSDSFIFTVKGYGHGVGMSQEGANLYAQSGWTYEKILSHYYPGAVLS